MYGKAGALVQRKKLPKRNWVQKLMYNWYLHINYRLNIIPMRNSRFRYTLRLIIGILIWMLKKAWIIFIAIIKFLDFGFTIKKGKTRTSKTYLITIQGYAITIAFKKMKSKP